MAARPTLNFYSFRVCDGTISVGKKKKKKITITKSMDTAVI